MALSFIPCSRSTAAPDPPLFLSLQNSFPSSVFFSFALKNIPSLSCLPSPTLGCPASSKAALLHSILEPLAQGCKWPETGTLPQQCRQDSSICRQGTLTAKPSGSPKPGCQTPPRPGLDRRLSPRPLPGPSEQGNPLRPVPNLLAHACRLTVCRALQRKTHCTHLVY